MNSCGIERRNLVAYAGIPDHTFIPGLLALIGSHSVSFLSAIAVHEGIVFLPLLSVARKLVYERRKVWQPKRSYNANTGSPFLVLDIGPFPLLQ